jgi:hypothetical protein
MIFTSICQIISILRTSHIHGFLYTEKKNHEGETHTLAAQSMHQRWLLSVSITMPAEATEEYRIALMSLLSQLSTLETFSNDFFGLLCFLFTEIHIPSIYRSRLPCDLASGSQ